MAGCINYKFYHFLSIEVIACDSPWRNDYHVDKSGQRIIFSVNDDGTVTSIMDIDYVGATDDFIWVVQVPTLPRLGVVPESMLDSLDFVTTPEVRINKICDGRQLHDDHNRIKR